MSAPLLTGYMEADGTGHQNIVVITGARPVASVCPALVDHQLIAGRFITLGICPVAHSPNQFSDNHLLCGAVCVEPRTGRPALGDWR